MPTLSEHLGAQNITNRLPLQPGEPAPDFALPALNRAAASPLSHRTL